MNVAGLELCKKLYEVSGWEDDELWSWSSAGILDEQWGGLDNSCPAYDLGYLLRKLPKRIGDQWLRIAPITDDKWAAYYIEMGVKTAGQDEWADIPEDAASKLCLELFKQGILIQEATNNAKAD